MKGERVNVYFDAESYDIIRDMKKGILSNICQNAVKEWINKFDDPDFLKEKLSLLEKDYQRKLILLNQDKQKSEEKIEKENNNFISLQNKTLELLGNQEREKFKEDMGEDNLNEFEKEDIKSLIKKTFYAYIDYFYTFSKPEGNIEFNPKYEAEEEIKMSKFNKVLENLFEKFIKNYKVSPNKRYFDWKIIYFNIKSFINENIKAFSSNLFVKNEDPNRYKNSELYLYMPLKFIGKL